MHDLEPISQEPSFSWSDTLVTNLTSLEYLRGACDHCVLRPAVALRLRYDAFSSATTSSAVSQRDLSAPMDVAGCIGSSERTESTLEQTVRNYWRGLNRLEEAVDRGQQLTEDYVQEINRTILSRGPGIRGTKSPYRITERPRADTSFPADSLAAPHPSRVSGMIRDLFHWWSSKSAKRLPSPLAAAIFSYRFARIQPFNNGNGQTARLAATAALWLSGYYMNGWWSFARDVFSPGDKFYDNLLRSGQSEGATRFELVDYTDWLSYFVGGLGASARVLSRLLDRNDLRASRSELGWMNLSRSEQQVLNRCLARTLSRDPAPTIISTRHLQIWFSLPAGAASTRLDEWLERSFVVPADPPSGYSERCFRIDPKWESVIAEASEMKLMENYRWTEVDDPLFGTHADLSRG